MSVLRAPTCKSTARGAQRPAPRAADACPPRLGHESGHAVGADCPLEDDRYRTIGVSRSRRPRVAAPSPLRWRATRRQKSESGCAGGRRPGLRFGSTGDVVSVALGQALATGYHGLLRAPFADPVKGAHLSRGCTEVRRPFRTTLREERPTLPVWSIFGARPTVASVRKVGRTSCRDACHHQRSPRVISIGAAKRVCGLKMEGPGKPHDIPIQRVATCRAPSMIVRRDATEPLGGGRKSVGCEEVDRGEIVRSNL